MAWVAPRGWRFEPSDSDLLFFLGDYVAGRVHHPPPPIGLINIYQEGNPWNFYDLLDGQNDKKFVITTRETVEGGKRFNRRTGSGVWKETGKAENITQNGIVLGERSRFKFKNLEGEEAIEYLNNRWVLMEYRLPPNYGVDPQRRNCVICRISRIPTIQVQNQNIQLLGDLVVEEAPPVQNQNIQLLGDLAVEEPPQVQNAPVDLNVALQDVDTELRL